MKTVREVIRHAPVWVNPEHTTESATVLMRGHHIGALPVLDGTQLVGIVLYSHLLGLEKPVPVREVMDKHVPAVSPNMTVRAVADVMNQARRSRLPVLDNGRLVGVVTEGDLLPELGRSYDPLTELPWADTMREWAIDELKRGHEITVVFVDVDDFGHFNKVHGHIVGDEVLKSVASRVASLIAPDTDCICRYGGDEFCIATVRSADEASRLGESVQHGISEIDLPSLRGERITCTFGQFGGKRTREREQTHYAATLNSLINLASRDCMERKMKRPRNAALTQAVVAMQAEPLPVPRLRLSRIEVSWTGPQARVQVDLERELPLSVATANDRVVHYSATTAAETDEAGVLRVIAETTASAIRSALPGHCRLSVEDLLVNETATEKTVVTALVNLVTDGHGSRLAGSAVVGDDRTRAAAAAVLDAVNRPLASIQPHP